MKQERAWGLKTRLDTVHAGRLHAGSMNWGLRRVFRFGSRAGGCGFGSGAGGLFAAMVGAGILLAIFANGDAFGAGDPNLGWIEVRSAHFVVASNAGEK